MGWFIFAGKVVDTFQIDKKLYERKRPEIQQKLRQNGLFGHFYGQLEINLPGGLKKVSTNI